MKKLLMISKLMSCVNNKSVQMYRLICAFVVPCLYSIKLNMLPFNLQDSS